ncbi:MAG TPA: HD domain-containing protein [Firmicutes bacterium]|nr:HD domain-containing protein [Bacillota bacterium]
MRNNRLQQQIEFIIEIDKLKQVYRQSILMDGTRRENDAEHSWHLALMSILLEEYSQEKIDLLRVVKMVLIHDLVEIDAGDTYCYEGTPYKEKLEREKKAADRLFSILPPDQMEELQALWEEFEKRATPEARFAAALDRLQPLLHNYKTKGESWKKHGVTSDKVIERNKSIIEASKTLWDYAETIIKDSIKKGYLPA